MCEEHNPENYIVETTETWPTGPLDTPREVEIYVCGDCGEAIDLDIADPALDRAEALADMEQDR